ncbi:MAG: aquaporin [Armatimonadetes bacterium]|nr:aquaporin [Akkermansiaceae bacterium]
MRHRFFAELLGTFILVFAGTGAIVVNEMTGGTVSHVGVALTFGLVVAAMIYTFGDVSGAHFNPAVSIAFALTGRFPFANLPAYISAQMIGALGASGTLKLLFPDSQTLGMTLPTGTVSQSFFLEIILTAILMLTILSVSHGAKEKGITAAIAIGSIVGLEAMFAGPICGASMNPARSLGPAILSGNLQHIWLYPTATILGAAIAIPLFQLTRKPESDQ